MRFHSVALLTGATAAAAGNTATLLLPGFQGRDLQAGVLGSAGDATTYLVTCPKTVAASACGIPGTGMTAIAAPTSMQLINVDNNSNTASVSCNVASTTYASCSATEGTVTVQSTLGPNNLNWMPVTVTGPVSTSTPTPTPTPTPTSTATPTSTVTPTSPTSTATPSSSFVKSSTPVSSSRMVSTPLITPGPTDTVITGTPMPTQAASSTPVAGTNAASSLSGNGWTVGGAVLALVYALA